VEWEIWEEIFLTLVGRNKIKNSDLNLSFFMQQFLIK